MTLGERMLHYRALHGINQTELARLLGTYLGNISRIERGTCRPHKVNELKLSERLRELEKNGNVQVR